MQSAPVSWFGVNGLRRAPVRRRKKFPHSSSKSSALPTRLILLAISGGTVSTAQVFPPSYNTGGYLHVEFPVGFDIGVVWTSGSGEKGSGGEAVSDPSLLLLLR